MNNNDEINKRIRERIEKNEEFSVEMARIGIANIYKENPKLREEIDNAITNRWDNNYED